MATESLTPVQTYDQLNDRIRYVEAICQLMLMQTDADDCITAAASHMADLMTEAGELAQRLYDPETAADVERDTAEVLASRGETAGEDRFLSLLILAGIKDRFTALEFRRTVGLERAVEFLKECTLSAETDTDERARLFECVRRAAHAVVNAQAGHISQSLAELGPLEAISLEIERLRGWLESCDEKLGVLKGAADYGKPKPASDGDGDEPTDDTEAQAAARVGLHAQIVAEIRGEYPEADEQEIAQRVAIRECVACGMTAAEEAETFERLARAGLAIVPTTGGERNG